MLNDNHQLKKHALAVITVLDSTYPDAKIELKYDHNDPWQLLVVVSLSAQSTDKKVNEISENLFKRFPNVYEMAKASPQEVEPLIKTLGLFRNKAKNLVSSAQKIVTHFNGQVPHQRLELETLAGVGKKTSAVIVANAFGTQAIAVDTHVARVSYRLGLTKNKNPDLIEKELTTIIPSRLLLKAHHAFIFHGRRLCFAQKPVCSHCPLLPICPRIGVTISQ